MTQELTNPGTQGDQGVTEGQQNPQEGVQRPSGAPNGGAPTLPPSLHIGDAPAPVSEAPAATSTEAGIEYENTGDPGLDMALGFFGSLGLGPDNPAIVAAANGDFSMLKAVLGSNAKAAGWENYVALAERAHSDGKKAYEEEQAKIRQTTMDAVGGEENWAKIQEWATANAEPAEKEAINAMLGKGGLQAKIAAQWLNSQYMRSTEAVQEPAEATGQYAASTPPAQAPMTAQEYSKQVDALRSKLGASFDSSREYQALQQRRIAARNRGL